MAKTSLRARLQRLFSTNVIVRHAGGRKLKIADTDKVQQKLDGSSKIHITKFEDLDISIYD